MSESNARKRNLPSWMSSRKKEDDDDSKSPKQQRNPGRSKKSRNGSEQERKGEVELESGTGSIAASDFSKLMEGVVFVLSGFVNPERGILRSQMLEMGGEYQPDWNTNCTLLVCAFANTPKFRQVKADGGTIISKDWISECYAQRKLVDIEIYQMHVGKPWRSQAISHESKQDNKPSTSSKSSKQEEKGSCTASTKSLKQEEKGPCSTSIKSSKQEERGSCSKKITGSSKAKGFFSPSTVKKWAMEDLKRTISWLENQDVKPEPGEIKKVAAEGILTCLQDVIDAFKQGMGIQQIVEQWGCIPQVVEKLSELDNPGSPAKEDQCKQAMLSKQIYELEFLNMENDDALNNKMPRSRQVNSKLGNKKKSSSRDEPCYDSDTTVEMTEEEIEQAFNEVASSL